MSALTDTDLTVLEGLDFAPPCEAAEVKSHRAPKTCDVEAQWVVVTLMPCGCVLPKLFCGPHKDWYLGYLASGNDSGWFCRKCGEIFPAGPSPATILRVEPI